MIKNINNDILNNALDVAIEIGDKWLEVATIEFEIEYPDLDTDDLTYLDIQCKEILHATNEYPYQIEIPEGDTTIEEKELRRVFYSIMLQKYPWVDDSNMDKLYHRARYMAWHDGIIEP